MTSWFMTKNGRLFTRTVVGVAATSLFGVHLAFNGPLLNTYQSLMQMYKRGEPRQLPTDVLQRADVVLSDCGLNEKKEKVKFFAAIGQDLFHAGSPSLPWGAIIGLPFVFGIKERSDIDFNSLKVHKRNDINWASEGEQLLQSLVLSENAQKFAIAREVFSCDTEGIFVNALLAAFAILLPAKVVQRSTKSEKLMTYHFGMRAAFYTSIYICGFIIYKCLKNPNEHSFQKECDKKAASLGPEYLEGGIEFYTKVLSKNKALRKLMGPDGEKVYDLSGNESYLLFAPFLPVSKRLELLEKMKEEQDTAAS